MAYKPQNLAQFRDDSSSYPKGSSTGKGGGVVPGTTGSDDRESQKDYIGDDHKNVNEQGNADYSFFMNDGEDKLGSPDPRTKENFGRSSYSYNKPTL